VPFVRVSRDRRGYETIFLVHTPQRRGRPAPAQVLYAFRTPPGVKVGRDPFDDDVRRALEARYPDVSFDWARLSNIPAPPPDVEHWRERRRAERAAKQARRAEERVAAPSETPEEISSLTAEPAERGSDIEGDVPAQLAAEAPAAELLSEHTSSTSKDAAGAPGSTRKRRRRRGGRGRAREPQGSIGGEAGQDRTPEADVSNGTDSEERGE
jgi:hypothetical protein